MADPQKPPFQFNTAMAVSILTKVLLIGGSVLVGKNLLTQDQLNSLVGEVPAICGGLAVIGPILYGIWATSRKQKLASAAALKGATVLLDSQAEADKFASNPGVVGPKDPIPVPPATTDAKSTVPVPGA